MEFRGTVQGGAARKYAGFTYHKAIIYPITMHSVDPDRLYPMHEYPRFCPAPSQPDIRTIDLADYVVKFGHEDHGGMTSVEVWILPNEYTAAQAPVQVSRFHATNAFTLRHRYVDEALKMAFGENA